MASTAYDWLSSKSRVTAWSSISVSGGAEVGGSYVGCRISNGQGVLFTQMNNVSLCNDKF